MSEETVTLVTTWTVKVVGVLVVFYIAYRIAGWASRKVRQTMIKRNLDKALAGFTANLVRWGLILLALLACLGAFGIETASFAALIAGAGLAIGLAFQGSLSNFAAGVMLLMFRPFTIGDVVNVGGVTGKVKQLGIFATDLDTPDNRRIILPNSAIFGSTIENITHHPTRRIDVSVGVAYDAPVDETRKVLLAAAAAIEGVLDDPAPEAFLAELGASSVDWQIRCWGNTADYWAVRQAIIRATKLALDEAGFGIPYQTIDVNMVSAAA